MDATETVEDYSRALREADPLAPCFVDREDAVSFGVSERLAWTDATGPRQSFDTRWSGVLERVGECGERTATGPTGHENDGPRWQFAGTHVSAPRDR